MKSPSPLGPLLFSLETALCQSIALGGAVLLWDLIGSWPLTILGSTLMAASVAKLLQLPLSWLVINTALPLSIALTLLNDVPGWLFLAPLVLLLCIYAPAFWTRVPYYPTSKSAYPLILAELPLNSSFSFMDIGCGFGDLLFFLAAQRPQGTFVGIEIGVLPYLYAKARSMTLRSRNVTISFRGIEHYPLSPFNFVYAFLSPAAMGKVWDQACSEMKPGSIFITNSFKTESEPSYQIYVKDERGSVLFVHTISAGLEKRKSA